MERDDLTFACIPDVHGRRSRLRSVLEFVVEREPDAILAPGDFAPGPGSPSDAEPVPPLLEETALPVFSVPGNHDPPDAVPGRNLDRRLVEFRGVRLYGVGGAGPELLGFPYEWTDEELARREFPEWDLMLSHAPPRDCRLDRTASGRHVGSAVLRRQVESRAGFFVCGHIHEAVGAQVVGGCLCYNAGSLGRPHAAVQAGRIGLRRDDEGWRWRVEHHVRRSGRWVEAFSARIRLPPADRSA